MLKSRTIRQSAGRPKGARNRLGEAFIEAIYNEWQHHGLAALEACRENDPTAFIKIIVSLLPRELKVETPDPYKDVSDEQLRMNLLSLDAQVAALMDMEELDERIANLVAVRDKRRRRQH